jgi:hypothetical protein
MPEHKSPHEQYLDLLVHDMREAVREFRKADRNWNELSAALNDKLDAEGTYDIVQRAKVKEMNLTLAGYMDEAKWWRDKAHMLATVLQAEKGLR